MRGPLGMARALRGHGVLGLNERNASFVLPLNPRKHYPRVDDKLLTKRLAEEAGIPIPPTLGVISHHFELAGLPDLLAGLDDFVLKPARGCQGNGIVVIVGNEQGRFRRTSGQLMTRDAVRQHVSSTISGVFSLRGDWDSCIIETRVVLHPAFTQISRNGIPDVRVVVYRGVPAMAMSRLPTLASDGRANLHQGAIGAGIDLASGHIVHAMMHDRSLTHHVDTGENIIGFRVPQWDQVLDLGVRCADISGLGYLGVDLVIDAARGPLLLELNARPGLAVQVANAEGMLPRLRAIDAVPARRLASQTERCAVARELFARSAA
jgi:alpha-L-glutamate ligase-like protein